MSAFWWLAALFLILLTTAANVKGARFVERITGRESRPSRESAGQELLYDAIFFGVSLGIGLPPIYFLPDYDPLVYCAFFYIGALLGGFLAQAFCGRRVAE